MVNAYLKISFIRSIEFPLNFCGFKFVQSRFIWWHIYQNIILDFITQIIEMCKTLFSISFYAPYRIPLTLWRNQNSYGWRFEYNSTFTWTKFPAELRQNIIDVVVVDTLLIFSGICSNNLLLPGVITIIIIDIMCRRHVL